MRSSNRAYAPWRVDERAIRPESAHRASLESGASASSESHQWTKRAHQGSEPDKSPVEHVDSAEGRRAEMI